MRKQNSDFVTKFISESGTQLFNSDYFAFVEMDNLACYVLADGIDASNEQQSQAAKMAVNRVIAEFTEAPSMRKFRLDEYLNAANSELRLNNKMWNLKASLILVVTDYVKLRYAEVGNTRLRLYRNGHVVTESSDQSLSTMLVDEQRISKDKIATHEERNNLYTWLGQNDGHYKPYISKKFKLMDGDILSLYSRGIWEKVPDVDLDEVFADAGDDPQKVLDQVEDLLFAPNPEEIGCYTIATIFVNKVFIDPNRKKKIRKIILVSVIVLVVVIVLSIVIYFLVRHRTRQREEMNLAFTQAEEYMTDNNFVRALEELKAADALAKKLWDKNMRLKIGDYQMLCEAVNSGHTAFDSAKYEEAEEHFLTARGRSRYADNLGESLIEKRLANIRDHINVLNYLTIGDTFFDSLDYLKAMEQYGKARRLAASVNYADGRQQALAALDKVARAMEEQNAQGHDLAQAEIAAADLVIQGDNAAKDGDYTGANLYYTMAKEKYTDLDNAGMVSVIDDKITANQAKLDEYDAKMAEAEEYTKEGRSYQAEEHYWNAKQQYLLARQIYSDYKEDTKLREVQERIDICDSHLAPEPLIFSGR